MVEQPSSTWLRVDGEMAQRVRAFDWGTTPLGSLSHWPAGLRSAVALMLDHPLPMALGWGADLITIYNDAYLPLLRGKAEALGRPFLDVWSEARDVVEPQIASALKGRTVRFEGAEFTLQRGGKPEQAWFDYSFSPLRDEGGTVTGLLNTAFERTVHVLAEQRDAAAAEALRESEEQQAFLLKFSDALRAEPDADAIAARALRLLLDRLALDRCYVGVYRLADDCADFPYQLAREGMLPMPSQVRLSNFPESLRAATDQTLVVDDAETMRGLSDADRASITGLGFRAFVAASLHIGEKRPLWAIVAVSTHPRHWTRNEIALIEAVTDRTWLAMERARAEQALRESEARNRLLVGSWAQAVWETDADGVVIADSPSWRAYTGQTREEWLGYGWLNAIHPDDRAYAERQWREAIEAHGLVDAEFRLHAPNGDWRWTNVRAAPVIDANGDIEKWAGMNIDITPRRQAEAALHESEQRFREFGENSSDALWMINAETRQLEYLSPAYERIWGESRAAVMADISHWAERAHPDDRAAASEAMPRLLAGEAFQADYRIIRPDGEVRWIRDAGFPIKIDGIVKRGGGVAQDVTDLKRAEAAVRESEARLRDFGDASQDVLWIRDAEHLQWQYLTPAFETIYGQSREDALAGNNYRGWLDLIVPEDRARAVENIHRVKAGEQVAFEYRIERPADGAIRWLRNTDFPIRNEAGEVTLIGGIGHDLTELREAELRLQALIAGIPQLVWRAGKPGHWTWASPQWTEFTGQREKDSRGWGWLEPLHPDDRRAARDAWNQAVEHGRLETEYRICAHQAGTYRWFQTRATPVRDEAGVITEWLGTSTDINDLREMQARQGVMVAELQHRTRNLITVVSAVSRQTLKNATTLNEFDHAFGDRLAALSRVQGLLSHLSAGKRVSFDELLRSELAALGAPENKVTLDGPAGVPLRSASVQTFALALHELATNALKYGALASAAGHLVVRWTTKKIGDQTRLHVDWCETGVEMTHVGDRPRGGGYGRQLIERALPYQLGAKTSYALTPDGVHCTIDVPTSAAAE